jgi:hypothetical protein
MLLFHRQGGDNMENNRLLQYINSLSEEEREKYKSLIDDALRRDRELTEAASEARRQAGLYALNSRRMWETTQRFHASLANLNGKVREIAEISRQAFDASPPEPVKEGHSNLLH